MSFTVNRKLLLNELALLQTVAETKTTMPVLAYVKFEFDGGRLVLTATNIDVSIVTEVPAEGEPWAGCLPSAQLYALVKLLDAKTAETITFTMKDGPMQVKAGKSKHLLPVMQASEFPQIEQVQTEGVTVPAAQLNTMLSTVDFAMLEPSDGLARHQQRFTGVHVQAQDGQFSLTATNITRLATVSCAVETPVVLDVVIPRGAVTAVLGMREGDVDIDVTESFIHLANGKRHLYAHRLIDDRFPDWRSMFPAQYDHIAEVTSEGLNAAIRRAMLTQNERRNMVIDGLRWTWTNGELLIETRGGDKGKSDEVVEVTCASLNGSSVALGMNGQQVLDALPLLGEKVTCGFADDTFIVELKPQQPSPINFTYYINTVSLKNWQ